MSLTAAQVHKQWRCFPLKPAFSCFVMQDVMKRELQVEQDALRVKLATVQQEAEEHVARLAQAQVKLEAASAQVLMHLHLLMAAAMQER